ncbi:putative Protein CLP1-like protein [Hypsibius exemplaris]|uniref:Clp1 P-loop domain-containing protein n=1 Tax=Hypsibius exemplaris TaxID=2072580 RepID=A0A1W0X4M9_HYPEX|nr:putative Protein CLP1-like protein [Hypsibius exemplaris]
MEDSSAESVMELDPPQLIVLEADFVKQIVLPPPFQLQVTSGSAEILGVELLPGVTYDFPLNARVDKVILTSFTGGTVMLTHEKGRQKFQQKLQSSTGDPMTSDPFHGNVACIHSLLRDARLNLRTKRGPRVMIIGPMNSGKTTCWRTLANYANLDGYCPVVVDLDPGQQGISMPGVLSSAVQASPNNVFLHASNPCRLARLDISFGRVSIQDDIPLYLDQIWQLKAHTDITVDRLHLAESGIIINTAGWIVDEGLSCLRHIAEVFAVDFMVCLESQSLYKDFLSFAKTLPSNPEVIFVRKPVGMKPRDQAEARDYRASLIRDAFFSDDAALTKCVTLGLQDLIFYRLSSFHRIIASNGNDVAVSNEILRPQEFMLNRLLYISGSSHVQEDLRKWPIRGYAVLLGFNREKNEAYLATTLTLASLTGYVILLYTDIDATGPGGLPFHEFVAD